VRQRRDHGFDAPVPVLPTPCTLEKAPDPGWGRLRPGVVLGNLDGNSVSPDDLGDSRHQMKRNRTRHEFTAAGAPSPEQIVVPDLLPQIENTARFEKVTGRATTRLQCEAGDRSHDLGHPGFPVGRVAANWFVGTLLSSSISEFLSVQVVSWQVQQPADQKGVMENVHRIEPRMRVRHPPRQQSSALVGTHCKGCTTQG
jgi:hypothetical protein